MDAVETEIYYGSRGSDFKSLINSLLIKGNLKEKYVKLLLSDENMKIYAATFTSSNVDPVNNYEYYEQLGDAVAYQFLVWYSHRRFPQLMSKEGVEVVARIKIKYGAKQSFFNIAESLGFWNFISETDSERLRNKKHLLEDVFEAFLGATASIIDNQIKMGIGYAITYDILKNIFDDIPISLKYEDLYDAKTRLKELFDAFKNLGTLKYVEVQDRMNDKITISTVYRIDKGRMIEIGKGSASLKKDAQEKAAEMAVPLLNRQGYIKVKPPLFE